MELWAGAAEGGAIDNARLIMALALCYYPSF